MHQSVTHTRTHTHAHVRAYQNHHHHNHTTISDYGSVSMKMATWSYHCSLSHFWEFCLVCNSWHSSPQNSYLGIVLPLCKFSLLFFLSSPWLLARGQFPGITCQGYLYTGIAFQGFLSMDISTEIVPRQLLQWISLQR